MAHIYKITPLEKKNIVLTYDVFEEGPDITLRGWKVEETYRWGAGFRSLEDAVTEWESNNNGIWCDPDVGMGAELDDLCSVNFEWDTGFTDEEKASIEMNWEDGGTSWLYDGEHNWQVESTNLLICGPVKIDLIDDTTNDVIEENVKPINRVTNIAWQTVPDSELAAWPFPTK